MSPHFPTFPTQLCPSSLHLVKITSTLFSWGTEFINCPPPEHFYFLLSPLSIATYRFRKHDQLYLNVPLHRIALCVLQVLYTSMVQRVVKI